MIEGEAGPALRRHRPGRFIAVALMVAAVVVTELLLWRANDGLRSDLDAANRSHSAAVDQLRQRLEAVESAAAGITDTAALVRAVSPSVFEVRTDTGLGTAWVVTSAPGAASLVTNYHVIQSAYENGARVVTVVGEGTALPAQITRVSPAADLALLTTAQSLPALGLASGTPSVGDAVVVVGSSVGLTRSVSTGIVSGFRSDGGRQLIQFTAPISPGNSGGPVVDSRGRVIGVTEAKIVDTGVEGISFAIPVSTVCATVVSC
ncbi:MAG TPA: S1C family serine protease [Candidatus Dormibacteraeota bacterium]|nr:S1C family serine protease [Candidatus Dormibacteraeota bacterium]